jgi:PAS domain S-box-containing protein
MFTSLDDSQPARSHFDSILNALPGCVAALDLDFKLTLFNVEMSERIQSAYKVALRAGMSLNEFLPTEARLHWEPQLRAALSGDPQFNRLYPLSSWKPTFANGKINGLMILNWDVTPPRATKSADLMHGKEYMQELVDHIPALVYAKDLTGRYFTTNLQFMRFTGKPELAETGFTDFDILPPDLAEKCVLSDKRVLETLQPFMQQETYHHEGETRVFDSFKFPLFDDQGKLYAIGGFSNDITEKVKALECLEYERERGVHSAKFAALGEMAGGIAHEINSPLAIISSAAGVMKMKLEKTMRGETFSEDMLDHCDKIRDTAMRISRIVRALLSFATQNQPQHSEQVKAAKLIEDTLEFCRERFRNNGVRLKVGPVADSVQIRCRPVEIQQVLLNLLNNAFDAVSAQNERWVEMDFVDQDTHFELRVTDSGPGIPREIQDKIMEPFFTTKGLGKGAGLGLSISKGIVEGHQGKLWVDRDCPNTRLCFELPK